MHNHFTCLLLSIYMPGNNYFMSSVRPEFSDTLIALSHYLILFNCNAQICCGDYNVSFDKKDAHLEYLKKIISINNLYSSWDTVLLTKIIIHILISLCVINHVLTSFFLLVKIYFKRLKISMLYLMLIINLIIMLLFYYYMIYPPIYLISPLHNSSINCYWSKAGLFK